MQTVDCFFVKNRQKSKIVKNQKSSKITKFIKLVPHFDLKIFRILTQRTSRPAAMKCTSYFNGTIQRNYSMELWNYSTELFRSTILGGVVVVVKAFHQQTINFLYLAQFYRFSNSNGFMHQ